MVLRLRRVCVSLAVVFAAAGLSTPSASALSTPTGGEYRRITFPVIGNVHYSDDFGACRDGCRRRHEGIDIMGAKLMREVAAADGRVSWLRADASGTSGNMLDVVGNDGWTYVYIHINNDTPGTDDGANPPQWRFAPGIRVGARVHAGQFIAYMGDSGNAEGTSPHLHFELHRPDGTPIDAYTSLRLAQGLAGNGQCRYPSTPDAHPSSAAGRGYWIIGRDGAVHAYGDARMYPPASMTEAVSWGRPVVAMAPTPSGHGYWLTDDEGRVVAYGDARARGGTSKIRLNAPIIGMTPTVTGNGYWLLAEDGGIFSFGDARFFGSTGAMRLNAPVVGMAATPGGKGYWLLGRDGGIFSFGNAHFFGSTGAMRLDRPVLSMAATAAGRGYWLIAEDGGLFTFGDAAYRGSLPGYGQCAQRHAIAMAGTSTGRGYWILEGNGNVNTFGDAKHYGNALRTQPLMIVALRS